MAKKDNINLQNVQNLRNKTSLVAYGVGTSLDDENIQIKNIIQQTLIDTKKKIGERTNEKPIRYYNEINFGNAFSELIVGKDKKDSSVDANLKTQDFKKFMELNPSVDINALLVEEQNKSTLFNNYRIIHKHIPECAMALNIFKDNIMSPDDFTKLIFNVKYENSLGEELKNEVERHLDDILVKYEIEEKANEIIEETLLLGKSYYAVLSLENELTRMLNDPVMAGNVLNEEKIRLLDKTNENVQVLKENIEINTDIVDTMNLLFTKNLIEDSKNEEPSKLNEEDCSSLIASLINNIEIGSSKEMLIESVEAKKEEYEKSQTDIDDKFYDSKKETKKRKQKSDNKPMYLNGSVLRHLVPERVVELKVGDVCYGYYYAEEVAGNKISSSYLGTASGRNANGIMNLNQNNTFADINQTQYSSMSNASIQLEVGEEKLKLISNVFLNAISTKLNKNFIRKNKEFKDFIFDLVRQDFIIKKGLKLTYFAPEEVIEFEAPPVYRDITFFAKLYLSILTNNLLIKLGRAHDKRAFYINVGADASYEQAVQTVIQDIKTKDYKMEQLNDFNTVLNLTPGRFDDYFIPTINGERPVEIETLAGMDVDMNNEFVEYLKNSMISGMGCPRNLIDVATDVEYARSISASNANFVREIIRYQKLFTPSFTRMVQTLYKNEFRFFNNKERDEDLISIDNIKVQFPSPGTLAMTNMSDQIQSADTNADFIVNQIFQIKPDGSNEEERSMLKAAIVKDLTPFIDWDRYEEMKKQVKLDMNEKKIEEPPAPDPMMDPYAGGAAY